MASEKVVRDWLATLGLSLGRYRKMLEDFNNDPEAREYFMEIANRDDVKNMVDFMNAIEG